MGGKLISLIFKPSTELPELDELTSFLATDFARYQAGWKTLAQDAAWGDQSLRLLGTDATGGLVALFPSVAHREREFHDIIGDAIIAGSWHEDNRVDVTQRYGAPGIDMERPLRTVLVAPSVVTLSRSLGRALERAGVEVMKYSIFEIETADGVLRAVSFDGAGAPSAATAPQTASGTPEPVPSAPPATGTSRESTSAPAAPPAAATPATPPVVSPASSTPDAPRPRPEPSTATPSSTPTPRPGPRESSPVDTFISALSDANLKAMSEQVLTFLLARFPNATGIVNSPNSFTLNVGQGHLATIRMDKSSVWLEVGPERIPTNKIRDAMTLERAMNLPSVLDAISSVNGG